jgi:hypothetical protein
MITFAPIIGDYLIQVHTGAIEIFKRTGSLTKLQKAMEHLSKCKFDLFTRFRLAELTESDMPLI